jgi:hypothetical protein
MPHLPIFDHLPKFDLVIGFGQVIMTNPQLMNATTISCFVRLSQGFAIKGVI